MIVHTGPNIHSALLQRDLSLDSPGMILLAVLQMHIQQAYVSVSSDPSGGNISFAKPGMVQ